MQYRRGVIEPRVWGDEATHASFHDFIPHHDKKYERISYNTKSVIQTGKQIIQRTYPYRYIICAETGKDLYAHITILVRSKFDGGRGA